LYGSLTSILGKIGCAVGITTPAPQKTHSLTISKLPAQLLSVDLQQESHYHAYLNISRESATILRRRGSLQHPPGSEPPKEESIAVQTTPFFNDVWLLCNNCPVALKITHG